jgi:hypothetical protein
MNVYHLKPETEGYQSLALASEEERPKIEDRFDTTPIGAEWSAPVVKVIYEEDRPTDFATLAAIPAFGARAVDALGDLLREHGELLEVEGVEFRVFNVTAAPDALDEDRSEVKRFRSSGRILRILRYELRPEMLSGVSIFKLPQQPRSRVYVTDSFVERVTEAGLVGFDLSEVVWSG